MSERSKVNEHRRRTEAFVRAIGMKDGAFFCSNCGHIHSALEWKSLKFLPERCIECGAPGNGGHFAAYKEPPP